LDGSFTEKVALGSDEDETRDPEWGDEGKTRVGSGTAGAESPESKFEQSHWRRRGKRLDVLGNLAQPAGALTYA
jgi:hypothetical protein